MTGKDQTHHDTDNSNTSARRSKTAEQILDVAEMLIQTRGFSAISYQDIALALGIRKASIHYHFPSKTDLGVAAIERYAERFGAELDKIGADETAPTMAMLDQYIGPYVQFAETPDRVCLCGALAGEILALPEEMRARVNRFFKLHQSWLEGILNRGVKRGEFALPASAEQMARTVFSALQGALLVKRTTGDATQLRDVIAVLKKELAAT